MTAEKKMELADECELLSKYGALEMPLMQAHSALVRAASVLRSSAVGGGAREALEPFAKLADAADKFDKADDARACCFVFADMADDVFVTFGDCRKARSALQSEPVQPAGKGEQEPTVPAVVLTALIGNVREYERYGSINTPIANEICLYLNRALGHGDSRPVRPEAPAGVRLEVLNAFLAHADKHGDTNSDDRWHRGAGWAWREAAKMVRIALPSDPVRRTTQQGGEK